MFSLTRMALTRRRSRLQVLDASWCRLERLPEEMAHVTSLLELNLAHNNLTALPSAIGLMTRLVRFCAL
jgi:Leucine-rich repeat (LRR) protein